MLQDVHGIWMLVWGLPNSPSSWVPYQNLCVSKSHRRCRLSVEGNGRSWSDSWTVADKAPRGLINLWWSRSSSCQPCCWIPEQPIDFGFSSSCWLFSFHGQTFEFLFLFFASTVFWLAMWFSCWLGPVLNHLCRAILGVSAAQEGCRLLLCNWWPC